MSYASIETVGIWVTREPQFLLAEVESRTQGWRLRPITQKNFEAKVKDRPSWGQGQGPRIQAQMFSKKKTGLEKIFSSDLKKKGLQIFFSGKKGLQKFFFRRFSLEENKTNFLRGFWRFPTKFQRFKNSAVLEPRTGQFSRTWGQGQGLQNVSSMPRTSSRTPPLLTRLALLVQLGVCSRLNWCHKTNTMGLQHGRRQMGGHSPLDFYTLS